MEKTVGAVNQRNAILTPSALMTGRALFLAFALTGGAWAQTLQLNPADMLKNSGIGQPQPAAPAAAPAQETAVPATPAGPAKIAQGYLYVEPYQARFEMLMDAPRFLHWLNPLKEQPKILDEATQKAACEAAKEQVLDWCRLSTGGTRIEGNFIGVSMVKGKPGATLPMEPSESLTTNEAMFGFTWEYPTPPGPDEIVVEWRGFIEEITTLPVRIFFGSQSEVLEASTLLPKISWKAQGRLPLPAPLAKVPAITVTASFLIPIATILWVLGGAIFLTFVRLHDQHLPGGSMPFIGAWVLGAVLSWPILNIDLGGKAQVPEITEKKDAEAVLTPLLRNVYRAFDHRNESEIYDVLARSVDGELLRKLYLETIQALTLEGREGTRVTISEFSADITGVQSAPSSDGFITECQWTAMGNVGHWGHSHTRVNRYTAKVTITPVANAWKITQLEVTEARRL
jgi:hypothetical protein